MKSPIQVFSDQLDFLIKIEATVNAVDLPVDYIENLEVDVICSTYNQHFETAFEGLHSVLKVCVEKDSREVFCRITTGDGGVLIDRTNFTKSIKELLFKSYEGWSYF